MLLKRFKACGVHGYLNFDIRFNDDITFLTGINGSGKTSVVQSIISLITPSLLTLANLSFASMSVDVENDGEDVTIIAEKDNSVVTLRTTSTDTAYTLPPFVPDPDEPSYRSSERESQFYLELTTGRTPPHPVIEFINSLPTPMFLDLDRRARSANGTDQRRAGWIRTTRRARNIFNVTLTESLLHATALAESRFRELVSRLQRIGEDSRREMVLSLLTMNPEASFELRVPTAQERDTISNLRRMSSILPNILQISREEVDKRVLPFLEKLESVMNSLPADLDTQSIFRAAEPSSRSSNAPMTINHELLAPLMLWSTNQDNVRKINELITAVEQYNKQRDLEGAEITRYLHVLNSFLNNSQKTLEFDTAQNLVFTIQNILGERQINTLSSGEAQLFVILTHLFFNPAARRANVFIIDEPELSLHVQWQELFVESICAANPQVQYVLATHSPSIILDKIDKCRDLTMGGKGT
jgi:predicted ATPase